MIPRLLILRMNAHLLCSLCGVEGGACIKASATINTRAIDATQANQVVRNHWGVKTERIISAILE